MNSQSKEMMIQKVIDSDDYLQRFYYISNDTIVIEAYVYHDRVLFNKRQKYTRVISRTSGLIINDTTFILNKRACYYCYPEIALNEEAMEGKAMATYKFYPFTIKPDSSKASFLKKKWFKL